MTLLIDDAAVAALATAADVPEASRSSYWEQHMASFNVDDAGDLHGSNPAGTVSRKTGPLYTAAHWVLQWPYRCMGRDFPTFSECQQLGRLVARRQGRQFTGDMIRQVLTLALLRHRLDHLESADDGVSCVIGDGYGVMSALLRLAFPRRKVILVNLTKVLLLDVMFARRSGPGGCVALVSSAEDMRAAVARDDVGLIAVRADDAPSIAAAPVDLAINIVSMQEMDPPVIAGYFDVLRAAVAPETAFYRCNKLSKTLPDSTEVRFHDYPWRAGDRILVDGFSPWNGLVYSARPPFWHVAKDKARTAWHRLAWLEKDPAPDVFKSSAIA